MLNNITAYKVVNYDDDDNTYYSAVFNFDSSDRVKYTTDGKLIKPNKDVFNNFLFIFNSLENASRFRIHIHKITETDLKRFHIWEVLANNIRHSTQGRLGVFISRDFPRGTRFCSSLRMIKRII